jgi:1-acyl-sn-glycerol-3-phosphate acyltransferase
MKKNLADRFSDVMLRLLRPIGFVWMRLDSQTKITTTVDFRRKDPFVLVANHTYTFDVIQIALPFRHSPAAVSQEFLLSAPGLRWLLLHVAKIIPKSKGEADVRTIRQIFTLVKKGYPIMIMPEGDVTFFGNTRPFEPATAKLIKKLGIDVVCAKVKGGYLSKPRWATGRRRNRYVELRFDTLVTKEQIASMSVEDISHALNAALAHDDYQWQATVKHLYQGERLAEGFENVIYRCPICGAFHSFEVAGNAIHCRTCNTNAVINEYGLIEGFPVQTMHELDDMQRPFDEELKLQTFQSNGTLQYVDHEIYRRTKKIPVQVAYQAGELHIKHKNVQTIPVAEMVNPVLTMRRNFTFEYQDRVYLIQLDRYAMSFLRVVQGKY